jgi:hypothetical protein
MKICYTKTRTAIIQKSKLAIDHLRPFTQTPREQTLLNGSMISGEVTKLQQRQATHTATAPVTKHIIKTKVYTTISFSIQNHMKSKTDMVYACRFVK